MPSHRETDLAMIFSRPGQGILAEDGLGRQVACHEATLPLQGHVLPHKLCLVHVDIGLGMDGQGQRNPSTGSPGNKIFSI